MKKIVIVLVIGIMALALTACAKGYEYWRDEEYEYLVVDGVTYSTKVDAIWQPAKSKDENIGYIIENGKPNRNMNVYKYEFDDDNMMMMVRAKGIGTVESHFYREDYDWPKFDLQGVDYIGVSREKEDNSAFYEQNYDYVNYDKEAIQDLLNQLGEDSADMPIPTTRLYKIAIINDELVEKNIVGTYIFINKVRGKYWISTLGMVGERRSTIPIPEEMVKELVGELWV